MFLIRTSTTLPKLSREYSASMTPAGASKTQLALALRRHQPFLDEDGDGADGAVAAHRQAAARLDEEERAVGVVAHRLVEDRARHHVMAARLEHQAGADPVVAGEEILALLAHGGAVERRAAAGDDADRVAAGVGVDAEEGLAHGGCRGSVGRTIAWSRAYWKRSIPNGLSFGSGRPAISEATWRAVAAESVRPRWPWPKAKTMRGSRGMRADHRQRVRRRRPAAHPFAPAGLGQRRAVAPHHLPHRRGARVVGRGLGRGQLDRAADAQPVGERRGDEAVVVEEDRHRQVEGRRRERRVVAALGLERDLEAEAAHQRRATRRRRPPRRGRRAGRRPRPSSPRPRRSSGWRAVTSCVAIDSEDLRRRRSASRMASGLVTIQFSGAKNALVNGPVSAGTMRARLVRARAPRTRRRGAGAPPTPPCRRDSAACAARDVERPGPADVAGEAAPAGEFLVIGERRLHQPGEPLGGGLDLCRRRRRDEPEEPRRQRRKVAEPHGERAERVEEPAGNLL